MALVKTLATLMLFLIAFMNGCQPQAKPLPEQEPTPAPVVEIPPAQQITPTWVYAIIGIGAALAVVVIVYIIRTRKP
jgi:hypothetical protein